MYEDFQTAFADIKTAESLVFSDRLDVFTKKIFEVAEHNRDSSATWTKGINKFSDMTDKEFIDYFNLHVTDDQKCSATVGSPDREPLKDIPSDFDWRDYGVVSPVKSQGHCGSCWTFSTVGALESHYYISTATRVNFSEQVLVDCAREEYDCYGCKGGLPSYAFNFIRDHGLATNETYPYRAEDGKILYHLFI